MGLLLKLVGLVALLLQTAVAANIMVGGANGGWDMNTDLKSWASSHKFFTGDTLTFSFGSIHSVIEVPKADYDACTMNTPLQAYAGGSAVVKLNSQGTRYFICGTPGHCAQGMKVQINAVSASTVINPPPASPVIPTPTISSSPPPSASPVIATPTISSPPPLPASPVIPIPKISLPPPPVSPVTPTPTISSPTPRASPVIPTPTISSPSPAASPVIPTPIIASPPPVDGIITTPPSAAPQTAPPKPSEAPSEGDPRLGLADAPATKSPPPEVAQEKNSGRRQVDAAAMVLVVSFLVALAS